MSYGNQDDNRIGSVTRVRVAGDPLEAYTRNIGTSYRPSIDEIRTSMQVAQNDGYMARKNIFSLGTEGLNMLGPAGTNICQNQYDDEGNMYQRSFSIVA